MPLNLPPLPGKPGGPLGTIYPLQAPEGAKGVLGCAAFSVSISFSSVSLSSIFDLLVSPGRQRVPRAWVGIPSEFWHVLF